MDVLSKILSFAVAAVIIFQLAEGHVPPVIDTCTVTEDIIDRYSNSAGGSSCEIVKDLPPSLVVYENQSAELCVVTTNGCSLGLVYWNGDPYYFGRPASRTPVDGVIVFGLALEPEETSISENGSNLRFVLSPGVNGSVTSAVADIIIAGPPESPQNISVTFNCSTTVVTWSESPKARSYNVTIECGNGFAVYDVTVYDNKFEFNYSVVMKQCMISVYAVNPAGSSLMNSITKSFLTDSNYSLDELGVKFSKNGQADVFFNITVENMCFYSGPHYVILCAGKMCVDLTVGFIATSWFYKRVKQLQLPLHEHLRANVTVCDDQNCTTFSKKISTFHVTSHVECKSNGECLMQCEAVQGYNPVKGCVFNITDQDTNALVETKFVKIGETIRYNIEINGLFTISVYDWENGWDSIPPVSTSVVQVSKEKINNSNTSLIAGLSSVGGAFVLLIAIVLMIIVFVRLYKRRIGRQGNLVVNSGSNGRQGGNTDDIAIPMENFDDKEPNDETKEETPSTETTSVHQSAPSSVTDADEGGEGVVQETTMPRVVSETVSTSVYESDEPLMGKRSPPRPSTKRIEGSGGSRPSAQMTSQKVLTSKFTNTAQEETGVSMETGEPMVTVKNSGSTAGFLYGDKVFPASDEDTKGFSPARPSQAQSSGSEGQAVVSGVLQAY